MHQDSRRISSPWLFVSIGLTAVLIAHTLQGSDGREASETSARSHLIAVAGETRRMSEASPFRSADMTSVMGQCVLDLSRATIPAGGEAVVDVFALMGSVTLRVPDGWTVDTRAIPVFGGIRDNRMPRAASAGNGDTTGWPRLVLRGFVMMGNLLIQS